MLLDIIHHLQPIHSSLEIHGTEIVNDKPHVMNNTGKCMNHEKSVQVDVLR